MSKENPYKEILNTPELYSPLRYAFEGMIATLIKISKDKSKLQEYFAELDNFSERLLLMNKDLFKKLFILLQEHHFWHVYNKDEYTNSAASGCK